MAHVWDWQLRGACRDMNTELFFHPEREGDPGRAAREAEAKQVCRTCPVLDQCRTHSLVVREPHGIWGGLSVSERSAIIQDRPHAAVPRPGAEVIEIHRGRSRRRTGPDSPPDPPAA